jgi:AraC-like DNA-binding protein
MAIRPKKLSRSPAELDIENPRGDVLADVLGATLSRNVLYKPVECGAPWGLAAPDSSRAMFYVVARGAALLEVQGQPRLTLSSGDVVFIPHGTAHVLRDSDKTRPTSVCDGPMCNSSSPRHLGGDGAVTTLIAGFFDIGGARKPALLAAMAPVVPLYATDPAAGPWLAATVQLILAEAAAPGPASVIVMQRLADVLFIRALRALASRGQCHTRGLMALSDPPVNHALSLMHARVAQPWTVARLARRVGMSRSAFAARFTQLVGDPPLQYLARWRMARAAERLRDTDEGVGEVAAYVGYESVPSFAKAFKRWQGMSPGAFRKQRRAMAQKGEQQGKKQQRG